MQSINKKLTEKKQTEHNKTGVLVAFKNAFVADSLTMPVHWYYRRTDIQNEFPNGIKRLYDAPKAHPGAIMSLHSKQHGGRQFKKTNHPEVVGDCILKGKAHLWNQSDIHYHHAMQAGENTLNAHTALWMLQSMVEAENQYDESLFLKRYIHNMISEEPIHPDTYAESYHRGFFANWLKGINPRECAAVTHDTPSVGGLVRIGFLTLWAFNKGLTKPEIKSMAALHLRLTHPDEHLTRICFQYIDLLHDLSLSAYTEDCIKVLKKHLLLCAGKYFKHKPVESWLDHQVVGGIYSSACYITDAWPSLLFLANKYSDNSFQALVANAELGGDNVHRGFILATILALVNGQELDDLFEQLVLKHEINQVLKELKIDT